MFIIFLKLSVSAQVHKGFRWIGPDHALYVVDVKSRTLTKESSTKVITKLGYVDGLADLEKDLPGDFGVNTFYQGNNIFITLPGTGQYFRLDISKLKIERLDKTFFRGYNFNATQFTRKDTLFSIGGEGFWSRHNIITYFNKATTEWDLYDTTNENKLPGNNKFSGYSVENDAYFSAFLNIDSVANDRDIPFSVFDFGKHTWTKKGLISTELKDFAKIQFESVWTGKYLIIYRGSGAENTIRIIDPFQNKLYSFRNNKDHFFIINADLYYQKGYLYSRENVNPGNPNKIVFDSLAVKNIIDESKLVGKVYEKENNYVAYGLYATFIFIFGIAIFFIREPKNLSQLQSLTETEDMLLRKFINLGAGTISSVELNSLLQIDKKSYDNQRQIRSRIITSINKKLYPKLETKDLILRTSDVEDKRMICYNLNQEVNLKKLESLGYKPTD